MPYIEANKSQFYFRVSGLDNNTFSVKSFATENYGISKHYVFKIEVTSAYYLVQQALSNKPAHLEIIWGPEKIYIHGVICKWHYLGANENKTQHAYSIILASPLYKLQQRINARVFLNQSVTEIIEQVLHEAGWLKNSYKIKSNYNYPKREFTVQINETDLDFIERLLSQEGLFYVFDQKRDQAIFLVLDDINNLPKFPDQNLSYQSQSGAHRPEESIYMFNERIRLLTNDIKLKQYNYQTPEVNLEVNSQNKTGLTGQGTQYIYGRDYQDITSGQHMAEIHQQAIDWQRHTFIAESDCRGLQVGQSFTLTDHPIKEFNAGYRIIGMEISANQSNATQMGTELQQQENYPQSYVTKLLLIKSSIPYRTPILKTPQIHHIIPATIESNGEECAYLDEQGRYHLRLPFDQSKTKSGAASHAIRAMQPASGMHFPLRNNTQIALGFIGGNINHPIILGVISHPEHPSPVTSKNYTQNTIRTWGGNEITMEDLEGKQYVLFATHDHLNQLKLDAQKDQHKIILESKQGKLEAYARKTINIKIGDNSITEAGKDQLVSVQNNQQILTQNGDIENKSGRDILIKANRNILQQTVNNNINLKTDNDFQLETDGNLDLEVEQNDLQIQAVKNNINLHSNKNFSIQGSGNADMSIGNGNKGITVTKDGNLNLSGTTITLEAPEINIYQDAAVNTGANITRQIAKTSEEQNKHNPHGHKD
jgi:type VI secretion system secreted protein VgrG